MKIRFVNHDIILELDQEYDALSSTVDGGMRDGIKYVIHHQVPMDFNQDPISEVEKTCDKLRINTGQAIVFLTATDITKNHTIHINEDGLVITSITMGLTNTYNLTKEPPSDSQRITASTINIVVIINKPLTRPALVDAYRLVSEVKAVTLGVKLGIHGTVSDALTVMAPKIGNDYIKYAGPATEIGKALIKAVSDALNEALMKYNK